MAKQLTTAALRVLLGKVTATVFGPPTAGTNASPSVLTLTAHGLAVGDLVLIAGVTGNTNLNGLFKVGTVPLSSTFTLTDLSGTAINGNGTFGGTVVAKRLTVGMTPDDLVDLLHMVKRTKYGPGRLRDSDRPNSALETTIQTALGL